MKKLTVLAVLFAVAALLVAAPQQANARPQYLKGFTDKYDIAEAKELKCGVCHGEKGANKKVVSDYGKALGKTLGAKNVKGAEDITKALEAIEKEKCGDSTYGEVLKAGKLPPLAE